MRKVKGIFLENLELNDFPVDVQVRIRKRQRRSCHCRSFLGFNNNYINDTHNKWSSSCSRHQSIKCNKHSFVIRQRIRSTRRQTIFVLIFIPNADSDAFIDQQEWRLHEHVETSTKLLSSPFTPSQNQHPAFSATCSSIEFFRCFTFREEILFLGHAARRPGYFYWNVYFLIVKEHFQSSSKILRNRILIFSFRSFLSLSWHSLRSASLTIYRKTVFN